MTQMNEWGEWGLLVGGPRDGGVVVLCPGGSRPPDEYHAAVFDGHGGVSPTPAVYVMARDHGRYPSRDDRGCIRYLFVEQETPA